MQAVAFGSCSAPRCKSGRDQSRIQAFSQGWDLQGPCHGSTPDGNTPHLLVITFNQLMFAKLSPMQPYISGHAVLCIGICFCRKFIQTRLVTMTQLQLSVSNRSVMYGQHRHTETDPRHPATVRVEDDMKNDATFEVGQHSHDSLRTGV